MSFLSAAALAVALLVAAPIAAHLLRRRFAKEVAFPAAHLVPATPPTARRRSALEDRALFSVRALAVVALAVLGATPFVQCTHLSFARQDGASVAMALVIDDSLTMRAPLAEGETRFERAREGAHELLGGMRAGDSVAIVLAGAPARVGLATTHSFRTAEDLLDDLEPSDRATDLDGALQLATDLIASAPQRDKRVVLLSDLADGSGAGAPPLAPKEDVALWAPLEELAHTGSDCGIIHADRQGERALVRVACARAPEAASESPSRGRSVEIRDGDDVLGSAVLSAELDVDEFVVAIPADASSGIVAVLTGEDSIAADDAAPVVDEGSEVTIGIVSDPATSKVETGGPPAVEQALAALQKSVVLRPVPTVPDTAEELSTFAGLIVDDASGFTPELRRGLAEWVELGGVIMLSFGPRAAAAPLGSGFGPLVPGVVRWMDAPVDGIDPETAPMLGPAAASLTSIRPEGRAVFDLATIEQSEVLAAWSDGSPLVLRRRIGRGAVIAVGLPFSVDASDLPLRPAFLLLLDRFVAAAETSGGTSRVDAGQSFFFDGYKDVTAEMLPPTGGKPRPLDVDEADGRLQLAAPWVGRYRLTLDGESVIRAAGIAEREIALAPRELDEVATNGELGGVQNQIDASPYIALLLLALVLAELALRAVTRGEPEPGDRPPVPATD